MRILEVRFKNLNSLAGEWLVNFSDPAYISNGIFVITGPTGAGKTTIMDAVCLALYGRTPRLGKVTKTDNEVMSRQTGECYAEVLFETQTGIFRCYWGQHRARRRPDGELQVPKHEISMAESGTILESKHRDVEARVEKVTGMDFERFTRSMLLAQGGFAAFLTAPPEERAPILEQITGTGIYSQISIKVHERRGEERKKLEALQKELAGVRLLSEEEEQQLTVLQRDKEDLAARLCGKVQSLHGAISWLNGISDLKTIIAILQGQRDEIQERQREFAPQADLLDRAVQAMAVESDYVKVTSLRDQQNSCTQELEGFIRELPIKEGELVQLSTIKQSRVDEMDQQKTLQAQENILIQKTRELDRSIAEKKETLSKLEQELELIHSKDLTMGQKICQVDVELQKAGIELRQVDDYLASNLVNEGLVENLNAINLMFANLIKSEKRCFDANQAVEAATITKNQAEARLQAVEMQNIEVSEQLKLAEAEHQALIDDVSTVLRGREPGEMRRHLDDQRQRQQMLINAQEILQNNALADRRCQELAEQFTNMVDANQHLDLEIEDCSERHVECEKQVELLEKQMFLLTRIRDLEAERAALEDGEPCPLCGSTEHPFVQDATPQMDQAETALEKARKKLLSISKRLTGLQIKRAEAEKDMQQIQREIDHQKGLLAEYDEQRQAALSALKIEGDTSEYPTIIQTELACNELGVRKALDDLLKLENLEKLMKDAEKKTNDHRSLCGQSEKELAEALNCSDSALKEYERLYEEKRLSQVHLERSLDEADLAVARYGITDLSLPNISQISDVLIKRRDDWRFYTDLKRDINEKTVVQQQELGKLKALSEQLQLDLMARQNQYDANLTDLMRLQQARTDLYGDKDPTQEGQKIEAAVEKSVQIFEAARDELIQAEQAVITIKDNFDRIRQSIYTITKHLVNGERDFRDRLARAGFSNETDYLNARLPDDERIRLSSAAKSITEEASRIETLLIDKEENLQSELQKDVADGSPEMLSQDLKDCELELKEAQEAVGAAKNRLSDNQNLQEKQRVQVLAMAQQSKECHRWDALHELIGSADGKKYRNFAQGLTFEIMIAHANRQLQKLTDRYLLVRDENESLELNVVDSYQAGEMRSTRNLSGGEGFIVSLALALGLSQMASRNVRVDTLFLDEGFGTLDEDALETAVDTLAGLHQEGKLIGIISHVPALKEKIGTEIQVIPRTGGKSRLMGPGCKEIAG